MTDDISLDDIEKQYDKSSAEAIPEAVMWKQTILRLQTFSGITRGAFYAEWGRAKVDAWKKYQGLIISLYTMLKVKLHEDEKEQFKGLDDYLCDEDAKVSDVREGGILSMEYLNKCLDALNVVSERIGITKVEKAKPPEGSSMA